MSSPPAERSPLASVVIAVFNGQDTIAQAIDSVLAQRFDGDFELVVVNDGSTDETPRVLAGYQGRIKIVTQENRGLAAARNAGVRAACGQYVAFLDADDFWAPEKLSRTVDILEREPDCVLVYTDFASVDHSGRVVSSSFIPAELARCPSMDELLSGVPSAVMPGLLVIRRSTFDAIGGFSEQFGRGYGCESGFLVLLARERGRFNCIREPLVFRRSPSEAEVLRKIREWSHRNDGVDSDQIESPARYVENFETFMRLVRNRYGAAGRGLLGEMRRYLSTLLVTLGLTAMSEGNPTLARRCYARSLRYGPLRLKTYVRLLWSLLPPGPARTVSKLRALPRRRL